MYKNPLKLLVTPLLLFLSVAASCQKISDTIFFNSSWQMCEKPMAAYYRIGTLTVDSIWYYTGAFKDYSIKGTLLVEGEYSEAGNKDGPINIYDTEGTPLAQGYYANNKPTGDWEWKYTSGVTRAIIHFDENSNDFRFIFYRDITGKVLLENGSGDFIWNTSAFEDVPVFFKVTGSFANGKKTGMWKYYDLDDAEFKNVLCQETYKEDGTLKKSKKIVGYYGKTFHGNCAKYDFTPVTLKVTERMVYDNFFKRGPDSVPEVNLLNYLKNRTSVNIVIKNKKFEDAAVYVMKNLEAYRNKLDYQSKEIDGKIEFKLGDNSTPEDISVSGNITSEEKDFLLYLMSKFKNFEMPMSETIGYEQYHTIYFFSLDMKPYVPAAIRAYINKELFFTMVPKDKYIVYLDANKKKIKKAIRSEFLHYW
jgi:hypothetical protein